MTKIELILARIRMVKKVLDDIDTKEGKMFGKIDIYAEKKRISVLEDEVKDLKQRVKVLECPHEILEYRSMGYSGEILIYDKYCAKCGKFFGCISEKEYHQILRDKAKEEYDEQVRIIKQL